MYTQMDMQTDGWTEDRHIVSHYLSAEHKTEEYVHPDEHADRQMDRGRTTVSHYLSAEALSFRLNSSLHMKTPISLKTIV